MRSGIFGLALAAVLAFPAAPAPAPPQYDANPFVFPITTHTGPVTDAPGGLAVLLFGFLDADEAIDFVVVGETGASAYDHFGKELWQLERASTYNHRADKETGTQLGYHATAGVVGNHAFYFVDASQTGLVVVDGASGRIREVIDIGPEQWTDVGLGHLFSTSGPEDVILLKDGYIGGFTGYRNTNRVAAIRHGEQAIGWAFETEPHQGIAFAHMRVADVDGDGFDEICTGRVCVDHDGTRELMRLEDPFWGHLRLGSYTTLQVADLFPDHPGLEAFAGHYFIGKYGVRSFVFGLEGLQKHYESGSNVHSAVLGNLDLKPEWHGPEALIRSNKDRENDPPDVRRLRFLNFATGEELIQAHFPENSWQDAMEGDRAKGSYPRFIDWDGDEQQEVCLIERHVRNPRISVNDGMTGVRLMETAHRGNGEGMGRVFDVSGDGREEVIVWNLNEIAIYWNPDAPAGPVPLKRAARDYLLRSRHGSFVYNYPQ
ncbi:MAG: hypothetical protein JXR94_12460 [Candidatus Hydrogenedentes bacterium]|nr:hypothetical protein [Candidatus Hydrogenedentota bacterium]